MRVQESVQPDILTLGSIGSKVWEPLVPRTGIPWFQDWEELVHFLELGTRGSKIVKHWFERGGTSSSSNAEPVVLILGRIGSIVWEPAVPLLPQHIRTA